jgi:hypothetical protein
MVYKSESFVERITSPVVVAFVDKEVEYADGRTLSEQKFDKYWLVDSISVWDSKIILVMKENRNINNVEWIGEEAVDKSFF